ncbi:hypothetical protein EMPS_07684 [Entomortierella parvispora]|uniref:SPIN90/Ldb17 leucine-rich domain-containing protein n=1 Tax=Entomortierella parvispora TaxID=205924 RepID=A0A9P3LYD6_9FUNG|nr:hypothetical protein EMPS_07684 [Entomortierella parvispora]
MDFVTYQFESSAQFYAELSDLLEEGGFHDNPESQVNTFISLIVQYQDEFLDGASGQDLAHCCYRLFDSDLFLNNTLSITSSIIDRAVQSPSEKDMWITYHILLYAGKEFPKIYHWMLRSEYFAKLKYQIFQFEASKMQILAINIMFEICRVQSLKPCDLVLIDEDFLHFLLDLVERTRTDADELLNYGTIKLLLAFNEQFMLHKAACQATVAARANSNGSNERPYTPPIAKVLHYSGNPLLYALADRPGASTTFGENLIFMLNRAEEASLQMLILKLLYLLLTSTLSALQGFFYTNDLQVLVDVVIRELWDLPEEEESLRHAYLRVMGPLLTNTTLRSSTYKRAEIVRLLDELGGGNLDGELRSHLREWEAKERFLEQSRHLNAKITYRDRQSSHSPVLLASRIHSNGSSTPSSSPSITHATVLPGSSTSSASAHQAAAAQAALAAKSRSDSGSSAGFSFPSSTGMAMYGHYNSDGNGGLVPGNEGRWTMTPSACPSPVLVAETVKKEKLKKTGNGVGASNLRYGYGEQELQHRSPTEEQDRESTTFASVTSSASATTFHVQVSTPPSPPFPQVIEPVIRRDSQPRPASPTTLRLVERVLREWLMNCDEDQNGSGSVPSLSSLSLQEDNARHNINTHSSDNNGSSASFPSSTACLMSTSPTSMDASASLGRSNSDPEVCEQSRSLAVQRVAIPVAH